MTVAVVGRVRSTGCRDEKHSCATRAALSQFFSRDDGMARQAARSVGNFGALQTLNLSGCTKLATLPESLGNLTALQTLDLFGCTNLATLPESVGNLGALLKRSNS